MAAALSEGPGQIQEFLDILLRRKWQIIMPALIFLSLGIAAGVMVPKKYQVETQVELRELFLGDGQRQAAREHTLGVAENAPQQLMSPKRIKDVLENLKWPEYLTLDAVGQAEFNERTRKNLRVLVPRKGNKVGSSFVTIEYKDVNNDRAQEFLKALRKAWIEQVVERERTRYDVEYQKLLTSQHELDKEFDKANRELTDLRTENDISPTQPTPGKNSVRLEDPMVLRFEANSKKQDQVILDLDSARESLRLAREQLAETHPEIPKTRVTEGLTFEAQIEGMRTEQLNLERQLDGIRPAHPRYQVITRQLNDIDTRIAELELSQTDEEISQEFEANPDYLELEAQIKAHERDVGRLMAERESLRKLLESNRRDLRSLREAYKREAEISSDVERIKISMRETDRELLQKRQRREVVYGPAGNPFQVIQEVEPPSEPTDPNPYLIMVMGLVLGLGVGLGSAILREFSKSCFRSAEDLNRVLVMPVLGVIGPIVTRVERKRRLVRRVAVAGVSFASMAFILVITWAWANEPDLLGDGVNDAIETVREFFL